MYEYCQELGINLFTVSQVCRADCFVHVLFQGKKGEKNPPPKIVTQPMIRFPPSSPCPSPLPLQRRSLWQYHSHVLRFHVDGPGTYAFTPIADAEVFGS